MIPKGHSAVMAQRVEAPDSLDFFPTPPYATRALCEIVIGATPGIGVLADKTCWEPACGEGHMSEVLKEYFAHVHASDVHDYGRDYAIGSFIGEGADVAQYQGPRGGNWKASGRPDWIASNPPFNKAAEFVARAVAEAKIGVALLLRTQWLEGAERYRDVFSYRPPSIIAQFVERVPMVKGRWDPDGSTATSYMWFVWKLPLSRKADTRFMWIPPGQRQALERPDDRRRFAPPPEPMSLFAERANG
jgi:hypothetical protein